MRGLLLNSGGIDSPVAAYKMADYDLMAIHFDNSPYSTGTSLVAGKIIDRLTQTLGKDIPSITAHLGNSLSTFLDNCEKEDRKYTCIFCKRMMFRIAQTFAHRNNCQFLITGENLGQVASQTLHNIYVTSRAVALPIIRPLIGLDKLDIITLAERIGTYEISIENSSQCRAVPRYPAIRANLSVIEALEKRLDISGLIDEALSLSHREY
ncbi:MAG: tRNA 4-thiouridine(8) synthase ThiI [Theionarchaea archaeon]|nr:tRNA 4-thiouridine(8) synthase ThiI [Theionarchaea archaeon]